MEQLKIALGFVQKIIIYEKRDISMKHKIIVWGLSCILIAMILMGCNTSGDKPAAVEADTVEVTEQPEEMESEKVELPVEDTVSEEDIVSEETVEEESEAGIDPAYAQLYLDYIKALYLAGTADQFALINVNDDKIPELVTCSSEGSWEKDQVFLYTIYNDEVVLLISDIAPGLDGCSIAYYEGENLVVQSGAATGERYIYYQMQDGKLELLTSFSSFYLDDIHCSIDEQEVTEEDYLQAQKDFVSAHGAISTFYTETIDTDNIIFDNGYLESVNISSEPYMTFAGITDELKGFLKNTDSENENGISSEPWKTAYKYYLYDVLAGKQPIPELLEYVTYTPDIQVDFSLQNITGSTVPELLISGAYIDNYWWIYSIGDDGSVNKIGELSYYNPESNEVFVTDGSSFEGYSVYKIVDGNLKLEYCISEGDAEGQTTPYYRNQENISTEEFETFRAEYDTGIEKYGIKGRELNEKNIEAILGK